MDYKKSILLNSFVEYLRSLLVMVEQNYTYESVFRYFFRYSTSGLLIFFSPLARLFALFLAPRRLV